MLPLENSVAIVGVVFVLLCIIPLLSKFSKIPFIILMIIAGCVVGPSGLNIVDSADRIEMFGEMGIMFIMFLAGLELDSHQIMLHKKYSITFGALVFIIPSSIAFVLFHFLLGYHITTSLLVALMFSTQTLVSYPIISKLGLTKHKSSFTAIGGTVITDAAVLFALGLITTTYNSGGITINYLLLFATKFAIFIAVVFIGFPLVVKCLFHNFPDIPYFNFSLTIAMLFLAGGSAYLIGLEPIIGAFLTGIVLNKFMEENKNLLEALKFIGNAIFIPMFLLYVGMLIDYEAVFSSSRTLILALIIAFTCLSAKLFIVWLTGKAFSFSRNETGLLYGLTSAHAAVVIAIALIGYHLGIIPHSLLNAAVVLVLISCIVSPSVTQYYSKKIISEQK